MKALSIILGILMIIGGIYCTFSPAVTYHSLSWIMGAIMIIDGIGNLVNYSSMKKAGLANGWTIALAIISILCGLFLLGSYVMRLSWDLLFAILLAAWMLVGGVIRIVSSFKLRKLKNSGKTVNARVAGKGWGWSLAFGIILVIAACFCLANPFVMMLTVGLMVGIGIIIAGLSLISEGIAM